MSMERKRREARAKACALICQHNYSPTTRHQIPTTHWFLFREPQHGAIDGKWSRASRAESRAKVRPHPPPHRNRPRIRLDQAIKHLQKRGLTSPVMPNKPQTFPPAQFERHIPHSPKLAWPKALIFSADFTDFRRRHTKATSSETDRISSKRRPPGPRLRRHFLT
jgi:hypothetical protein